MPTPDVMYDEAIQLQQQGQIEEAVEKLCELVKEHPDYALAHGALSVFYSRLEKHDEAVKHAGEVCKLEAEDPFSFVAMSLICQKAGRIGEAERAMAEARHAQMGAHRRGGE